jgi:riboflavin synthase
MVFTGIVEEIGQVISLEKSSSVALWDGSIGEGYVLTIEANIVLEGAYEGCSIAVNGTCLTVTKFDKNSFVVGCAPETMRKTNLIDLHPRDPVNLERSMAANARNSGHMVQGHVDGTGEILKFQKEGDSLWVTIKTTKEILKFIVTKGYVAIDGTSLTVCDVDSSSCTFTFMLIAYTQAHIALPRKQIGQRVNIEVDVIGKLVEKSTSGILEKLSLLEDSLNSFMKKVDERLSKLEKQ